MQTLRPYWLAALGILSLLMMRMFLLPANIVNPDCALFLTTGKLIVEGARPYVDFVELNPPLVFYIHAIPVYIARLLSLPFDTSLYIFCIFTIALSLVLSWCLLRNVEAENESTTTLWFGPVILAFSLGNVITYEWVEFGQRQQLLTNALLPFFVCRYLRWQGEKIDLAVSIASGLFFGVMLCLLPQYVIIPLGLEVLWLLRRRMMKPFFAPEIGAALSAVVGYGLFIFSNESIRVQFLGRFMPMVSEGYALYNWPFMLQITQLIVSGSVPILCFAILLGLKRKFWKQGLMPEICVFSLCSVFSLLLQGKAILNQTIPLMFGSLMLMLSIPMLAPAISSAEKSPAKEYAVSKFRRVFLTGLITLVCLLVPVFAMPGLISQDKKWRALTESIVAVIQKETRQEDKVSILSLSLPDSCPALMQAKRESGNRYFFLFPILMMQYLAKKHAGTPAAERWQRESEKFIGELKDDLREHKPYVLFIQESVPPGTGTNTTVRQFLQSSPLWQEEFLDRYDLRETIKVGPNELSVWRRKTAIN